MRKICLYLLAVSIILLMVSPSSEGKSGFTNISVRGLNKDGDAGIYGDPGLPGYIEIVSTAGNVFYLFVDYSGILRLASEVSVGDGASPSIISWADSSGIKVSAQ